MERHFMGANSEAAVSSKAEYERYLSEPQVSFDCECEFDTCF